MLTIIKVLIILFLLKGIGNILAIFKINQQVLLFECPVIFYCCPNWRAFYGRGAKKGNALWDYSQEYLVVIRDEKVSPFVKFGTILSLLCFLLDLLTKKPRKAWSFAEFYDKFMDRFQDISKIRNPENLEPSKTNVLG